MQRVKNLLVRLLLWLLDPGDYVLTEDDKSMESWLARSFQDAGARQFLDVRRKKIDKMLGSGYAMSPDMSHQYTRHIGQKAEGLIIGIHMKKAYQAAQRRQAERKKEEDH